MIEPLLVVGIAIVCTAWYMRHLWRQRARNRAMRQASSGLDLLERRYVSGEIGREEYLQKKVDIVGAQLVPEAVPPMEPHVAP